MSLHPSLHFPLDTRLQPLSGIQIATVAAQIKAKSKRLDVVLFRLPEHAVTATVFTTNAFCAAPVILAKRHGQMTQPQALLINAGNANAGTGETGLRHAQHSCQQVAKGLGLASEQVLPFSTGVIGQDLPMDRFLPAIDQLTTQLNRDTSATSEQWHQAAQAILTTDTGTKTAFTQCQLDGQTVTIQGLAKGSGMIHPNMATMLGYVFTDANISQALLQHSLEAANAVSFNAITVDGDTSTNDACTLTATASVDMAVIDSYDDPRLVVFQQSLTQVMQQLAQAIVRDGEGATKFVSIQVEKGQTEAECRQVAQSVALSPLVKTALFASDPNWGRILAAVGRSGIESLDVHAIQIWLGDVLIVEQGGRAASYTEEQGQAVMDQADIHIRINLARGQASNTLWTTDLSYDYVKINAEYRT